MDDVPQVLQPILAIGILLYMDECVIILEAEQWLGQLTKKQLQSTSNIVGVDMKGRTEGIAMVIGFDLMVIFYRAGYSKQSF